jgi:hypothetical protein
MRVLGIALSLAAALNSFPAHGHGPQLQITNDSNKIVTRELHVDGPYSAALSPPKSVYVMPVLETGGVWYSQPNTTPSATIPGAFEFLSGPGLAYGYDLADGGPQLFAAGSVFSVGFVDGLKLWNGSSFADAGATQAKAFRGSDVNITTPPTNFAITSDSGPFDSLNMPSVAVGYGTDGGEVHSTVRFALLGDGASSTSSSLDGVYLLRMQLSSTQAGLLASDPHYFVLYKNASTDTVNAAVASLGVDSSLVQFLPVPEPSVIVLMAAGVIGFILLFRCPRRVAPDTRCLLST